MTALQGKIVVHHDLDELAEGDLRSPAECALCLRRVSQDIAGFGRAQESWVDLDVFLPIQPDVAERTF